MSIQIYRCRPKYQPGIGWTHIGLTLTCMHFTAIATESMEVIKLQCGIQFLEGFPQKNELFKPYLAFSS
jgi:hypothetical protein